MFKDFFLNNDQRKIFCHYQISLEKISPQYVFICIVIIIALGKVVNFSRIVYSQLLNIIILKFNSPVSLNQLGTIFQY